MDPYLKDETPVVGHPDPGPKWRVRFWAIFSGQALSLIGSALTQFVLIWWITDTTGSVSALSIAGLAALLPQAILGPLGGTLADRYSRRILMIGADAISAVCMVILIALFLTNQVALWHVYTMMFIRSSMQAFQTPAASASTAMLVPRSFLPRAAGLNQTLMGLMTVAAAPLGALAMSVMPLGLALGIDVLTAVLAIVPLFVFKIPQLKLEQRQQTSLWSEFREGVSTVWGDPGLRRLYGLLGVVILLTMPSFTLLPLLIRNHFGGGPGEVALMEGLAGLGMLAGGMVVAIIAPKRQMLWILLGFVASCSTLALTAAAPSHLFWLSVVWWSLCGVFFSLGNAPLTALLQEIIPNQLQGRVLALLNVVMGLAVPIGLAIATPLGELIGVRWLVVTQGALGAVVSLLAFLSPTLLKLGSARERSTELRKDRHPA